MFRKNQPTHISAFDLDHTILTINSSFKFGAYLYKYQQFSFLKMLDLTRIYASHKTGLLSISELHDSIFYKLFYKKSFCQFQPYLNSFIKNEVEKFFYTPALISLKKAQNEGHCTVLLSSSPHFLVEPIAQLLGMDHSESTHYDIDKQQHFCQISHIMQGEQKASALQKLRACLDVPIENVTAYTDSHLDLSFLLASGRQVGVNPNRQLKKICLQNNWLII